MRIGSREPTARQLDQGSRFVSFPRVAPEQQARAGLVGYTAPHFFQCKPGSSRWCNTPMQVTRSKPGAAKLFLIVGRPSGVRPAFFKPQGFARARARSSSNQRRLPRWLRQGSIGFRPMPQPTSSTRRPAKASIPCVPSQRWSWARDSEES